MQIKKRVPQTAVLSLEIQQSRMSREFKAVTASLGFTTLKELISYNTGDLEKMKGFTVSLIHEYVTFLEIHQLGDLIDD